LQISPRMPRNNSVQVSESHWSRGHMAAYIRPRTVQVRKRSTDQMPHHKHNLHFLSLFS